MNKRLLSTVAIVLFFIVIYSFHLFYSYNFDNDFGRDLLWMFDIGHGKQTLLGPKLSFGGYYVGPYYYYFFAPFLALTHFQPYGVLVVNMLLFAACLGGIYYVLSQRTSKLVAVASVLWMGLSTYFLFAARSPGNAFSYIGPLAVYLLTLIFFKNLSLSSIFLYGLWAGIMTNFHPVSLIAIVPLTALQLLFSYRRKILGILLYCVGFGLTLLPVALFEVKHHFVMFTNTFVVKSYEIFTNSNNQVSLMVPSKNPLSNMFVIDSLLHPWVGLSILTLLAIMILLFLFSKKEKQTVIVFVSACISASLMFVLLRFQVAFHYLFPLLVIFQVAIIYLLLQVKGLVQYVAAGVLVLSALIFFPKVYYQSSVRPYSLMLSVTSHAIDSLHVPKTAVNVFVVRETPIAALGYEYRYILRTLGFKTDDEFSYAHSQYLLLVSEKGYIEWQKLQSWELGQFGPKTLVSTYQNGHYTFYLFKRSVSSL